MIRQLKCAISGIPQHIIIIAAVFLLATPLLVTPLIANAETVSTKVVGKVKAIGKLKVNSNINRGLLLTKLSNAPSAKGVSGCKRGDSDCNQCTSNVHEQFQKLHNKQITWKVKPWSFYWKTSYRPDSTTPIEAYNDFGLVAHTQGFVRTNSDTVPYAMTHSRNKVPAGKKGSLSIIKQLSNGKKFLTTMHRSETHHPSGVHVLGKFVAYGESKDGTHNLRVLNLERHRDPVVTHTMEVAVGKTKTKKMFGGGLGLVKLASGTYLLVSSVGGGIKEGARYHQFYQLRGDLGDPKKLASAFIGEQEYKKPDDFNREDFKFTENVSLLTECVTRDIYAIHTSGISDGWWRLSKLEQKKIECDTSVPGFRRKCNKFTLNPIDVYVMGQNIFNCHMRSAATVGVAPNGKLEFLCHQYQSRNAFPSGKQKWHFKAGVPN